jgi:Mrp family chromosome partitioning ATPase
MISSAEKIQDDSKSFFSELSTSAGFQLEMDGIWSAMQARLGRDTRCIFLVTSASSGEGTTTVTMGLGKFVAENTDLQVLLVDADSQGNLLRDFVGDADLVPMIEEPSDRYAVTFDEFRTRLPNLNCLRFQNPQALETPVMHTEDMAIFMSLIKKRYHYVFVDAPDILSSNVSPFLARHVDQVIFVVAAGFLGYPVLQEALSRFHATRHKILGAVLNKREYPVPKAVYRFLR